MGYIIIAIVAFLLVKKLIMSSAAGIVGIFKAILFGPKVNSILTAFLAICLIVSDTSLFTGGFKTLSRVLWVICILDCIRDVMVAEDYYDSYDLDPLYVTKSIGSIFTLGMSRGFFLLIVEPFLHHAVKQSLRDAVKSGRPVYPYCSEKLKARKYYYERELAYLLNNEELVSNEKTLQEEVARAAKKLDKLYPKTLIAKIADTVAGDDAVKKQRERDQKGLDSLRASHVYLGKAAFGQIAPATVEAMRDRGTLCVADMLQLKELERFRFIGEAFMVQALKPQVENGTFLDEDISDDPLESHAYRYAQSSKQRIAIDASSDPRFADPDLCD